MTWHVIEGAAGCAFAVERSAVAVVVDALRASATAAMLLDAGARELLAVREVADAFEARRRRPEALLYGERDGLPPPGFDYGNSPRTVAPARGRDVIFTTTTGAGRLVACWGAAAVYMGGPVNASAVVDAAGAHGADVVVIPAGLMSDPGFDAQEDWAAAAALVARSGAEVGVGAERCAFWLDRLEREGLERLFLTAPHTEKLCRVGLEADIPYCARIDLTRAVPRAVERDPLGLVVRDASR